MKNFILALASAMIFTTAHAAPVDLTEDGQGDGNKGASFRPIDGDSNPANFIMTSRTSINDSMPLLSTASGDMGTVYIDDDDGAGVQTLSGGGSKGISGGGGDKDEELIFTYDATVRMDSIDLQINEIEFGDDAYSGGLNEDKDDPVLFLSLSGDAPGAFSITVPEETLMSAFTFDGSKDGTLSFGELITLLSLDNDTGLNAFKLRETEGHTYVGGISMATAVDVPEPSTYLMLGVVLAFTYVVSRRRQTGGAAA